MVDRPVACIQGLGFVGAAMAVAVASAREPDGSPSFNVVGVDLPTPEGLERIGALNAGRFPFTTSDAKLHDAIATSHATGNFVATANDAAYSMASTIVVDVQCDVAAIEGTPQVLFEPFRNAIRILGRYMQPGTLVILESTVPPGTCSKIVLPELRAAMRGRGFTEDSFLLAHSYERVMPGDGYFDSVVNFWRVYSGESEEAAKACEEFLASVVNVRDYPMTRLSSTIASETAKLLENSYRAVNIAFIEEWGRFAEAAGIDLFEVIAAIRQRPTHSNIRQPGFGVGGYCLTKDPLMAELSARDLLGLPGVTFRYSTQAVEINRAMPLVTLEKVQTLLGGCLRDRTILLMGVSYRPDVADTRYSPSQTFVEQARALGVRVLCHDPLVRYWREMAMTIQPELPDLAGVAAVVFAVQHKEYARLDLLEWLGPARPVVFDANNVLTRDQRSALTHAGCRVCSIGRGAGQ